MKHIFSLEIVFSKLEAFEKVKKKKIKPQTVKKLYYLRETYPS